MRLIFVVLGIVLVIAGYMVDLSPTQIIPGDQPIAALPLPGGVAGENYVSYGGLALMGAGAAIAILGIVR